MIAVLKEVNNALTQSEEKTNKMDEMNKSLKENLKSQEKKFI